MQAAGLSVDNSIRTEPFLAAIDTATTLIHVPHSIARAFYAQIPGAEAVGDSWKIPCSFDKPVGIQFANTTIINFSNADLALIEDDGSCTGAVIASDVTDVAGRPMAIIGTSA